VLEKAHRRGRNDFVPTTSRFALTVEVTLPVVDELVPHADGDVDGGPPAVYVKPPLIQGRPVLVNVALERSGANAKSPLGTFVKRMNREMVAGALAPAKSV
jgi:hypothetical protein